MVNIEACGIQCTCVPDDNAYAHAYAGTCGKQVYPLKLSAKLPALTHVVSKSAARQLSTEAQKGQTISTAIAKFAIEIARCNGSSQWKLHVQQKFAMEC